MKRRRSPDSNVNKNMRTRRNQIASQGHTEACENNEETGDKADANATAELCTSVAQEFICVCCIDVMIHPTILVPCGHSFCNVCIFHDPPYGRLEKCPTCREDIQYTVPNRTVKNAVQAMTRKSDTFFSAADVTSYSERMETAYEERNLLPFRSTSSNRTRATIDAASPNPEGRAIELQQEVRWLLADQQRTVHELRQQLRRRVEELRQQVQEVSDFHNHGRQSQPTDGGAGRAELIVLGHHGFSPIPDNARIRRYPSRRAGREGRDDTLLSSQSRVADLFVEDVEAADDRVPRNVPFRRRYPTRQAALVQHFPLGEIHGQGRHNRVSEFGTGRETGHMLRDDQRIEVDNEAPSEQPLVIRRYPTRRAVQEGHVVVDLPQRSVPLTRSRSRVESAARATR